jgi:hypothetical protein
VTEQQTNKVPQPEDPDWKKLEKIIADIQQALAPNATVTHDDRIVGKSGTTRKIDVSIKHKVGLNPVLIAIDCKHHAKPVERGDVAIFAEQAEDIGPCIGIMISDFSFDSGAKYVANLKNIILKTFTEAKETEWNQLFQLKPFAFLTVSDWMVHEVYTPKACTGGVPSEVLIPLHAGTNLFTQDGGNYVLNQEKQCVVGDLFLDAYLKLPRPRPIGRLTLRVNQRTPRYYLQILTDNRLICPPYIVIVGRMQHRKYPIPFSMLKGHSLKPVDSDKLEVLKVLTTEMRVRQVMNGQEGVLFTEEEWKEFDRNEIASLTVDDHHLYSLEFIGVPNNSER